MPISAVLGTEPRASCILAKHTTNVAIFLCPNILFFQLIYHEHISTPWNFCCTSAHKSMSLCFLIWKLWSSQTRGSHKEDAFKPFWVVLTINLIQPIMIWEESLNKDFSRSLCLVGMSGVGVVVLIVN